MKFKSGNRKPACDFIFVGNGNVCPICQYLREIDSGNVHNLDLNLQNGPMSNINIPIERPYSTFYLLAISMFALSVTIYEKFIIKMCMTLTLIIRMSQCQIWISQSKGPMRLSLLAIAVYVLSVTVCEIITFELDHVFDSNLWPS